MTRIKRFNGERFYLADAGTKSWMNQLAHGFRNRNIKARVVPDPDVKGDYCLYINDYPERWRGINGAPAYNVNPFFMWRSPAQSKRGITEGRADINYITKSGRVIPAKDMGAVVYRVHPSGRTTKMQRLSDKKKGKRKGGKCPTCGSVNTEPSWGAEGYLQCNTCGAEWRHPRGHTVKGSRKR